MGGKWKPWRKEDMKKSRCCLLAVIVGERLHGDHVYIKTKRADGAVHPF